MLVNVLNAAITAVVTLLGVALGGWLSVRNSDRSWRRDRARQWRDIRLTTYGDFLTAHRQYLALAVDPDTQVIISHGADPVPAFGEAGRQYIEAMDATLMSVRLVAAQAETVNAAFYLVMESRRLAAARAAHGPDELPDELFDNMWRAMHGFLQAARIELGLPGAPGRNDGISRSAASDQQPNTRTGF